MRILIVGEPLAELVSDLQAAGHAVTVARTSDDAPEDLAAFDAVVASPKAGRAARLRALVDSQLRAGSVATRDRLRVGLTYNVKRESGSDAEAEFDAPRTIDAIEAAIGHWGFEVVRMEATTELPALIEDVQPDFVFNIAEGWHGRSRESQVPSLLELYGVPFAGSDSVSTALTLDKALAKKVVAQAGLETPRFQRAATGREKIRADLRYPVIVKPGAEGSSKGIAGKTIAHDAEQARQIARQIVEQYRQPALVEEYITGREFTVGLIGNRRPTVLPPLEIVFKEAAGDFPVYSYEIKQETVDGVSLQCPADVDPTLRARLERWCRQVFAALELRDFARVDLRLDARGEPFFIEVNPLPGLTPGYSDLCLIAERTGLSYEELIGYVLRAGLVRHGFPRRFVPKLAPLGQRVAATYAAD